MNFLVVFATIEGQTGKIARFIGGELVAAGRKVALLDTSDLSDKPDFSAVDRVILAAPVHERRHPRTFEVFVKGQHAALAKKPTLMLSISLSAAFAEGMEEAQDYLTEMCMRTGITPTDSMLVAGAVRSGSYDYYESMVLRHVVLRDRDVDPSRGPVEFTDWDAVKTRVLDFAKG